MKNKTILLLAVGDGAINIVEQNKEKFPDVVEIVSIRVVQGDIDDVDAPEYWAKMLQLIVSEEIMVREIEWHQIGHLQANKVRGALKFASWIHAVDSLPLLQRIERLANEMNSHPKLLLEVNISGEGSKFGLRPEEVTPLLEWLPANAPAPVVGLMTMAPFDVPEAILHEVFGGLRALRDRLQQETGHSLPELSMGMSGDFEVAIQEGATIVRVGSAIFGHREYT